MTFIEKGEEPPSLTAWREAGHAGWDVPGDVKEDIRHGLWREQYGLCAFCCAKLPGVPPLQRIAHVEPRDVNPSRALDYANMAASCSSGRDQIVNSGTAVGAQSCDEKQGNAVLPVHPFQADRGQKFVYLGNGAILPASEGTGARETIDVLNLDCDRLRQGRMGAIRGALVQRERMRAEDWLRVYRDPPPQYRREFWPAIAGLP